MVMWRKVRLFKIFPLYSAILPGFLMNSNRFPVETFVDFSTLVSILSVPVGLHIFLSF